jgi:acetyltransferase-like isoleucine patch superfamily enzyme
MSLMMLNVAIGVHTRNTRNCTMLRCYDHFMGKNVLCEYRLLVKKNSVSLNRHLVNVDTNIFTYVYDVLP